MTQPPDASTSTGAVEPLLLDAAEVGKLLSISESATWRLSRSGRIPRPIRLRGSTRWSLDELRAWVAAGCPGREVWEKLKSANKKK